MRILDIQLQRRALFLRLQYRLDDLRGTVGRDERHSQAQLGGFERIDFDVNAHLAVAVLKA